MFQIAAWHARLQLPTLRTSVAVLVLSSLILALSFARPFLSADADGPTTYAADAERTP